MVAPGQATTITASLSAPDPGDAPRARVSDSDGVVVADLALSLTGDGSVVSQSRPFVRVDVTEMFPFLATKLMPYFER